MDDKRLKIFKMLSVAFAVAAVVLLLFSWVKIGGLNSEMSSLVKDAMRQASEMPLDDLGSVFYTGNYNTTNKVGSDVSVILKASRNLGLSAFEMFQVSGAVRSLIKITNGYGGGMPAGTMAALWLFSLVFLATVAGAVLSLFSVWKRKLYFKGLLFPISAAVLLVMTLIFTAAAKSYMDSVYGQLGILAYASTGRLSLRPTFWAFLCVFFSVPFYYYDKLLSRGALGRKVLNAVYGYAGMAADKASAAKKAAEHAAEGAVKGASEDVAVSDAAELKNDTAETVEKSDEAETVEVVEKTDAAETVEKTGKDDLSDESDDSDGEQLAMDFIEQADHSIEADSEEPAEEDAEDTVEVAPDAPEDESTAQPGIAKSSSEEC
ncbi:MAG: hypothetical protein PUB39_05810 [Eubacteriales bacterium]|nr:hypothetical protein [Eubacteriales bacterium]